MDDVKKTISMDAKEPGNLIFVVGMTYDEMGGSHYYYVNDAVGNKVPKVNARTGKMLMDKLSIAINAGIVRACHDCSEGGIGVSCAEMAFAGGLGMEINLARVPCEKGIKRSDTILFSESHTRFIVEVPRTEKKKFRHIMSGITTGLIGEVKPEERFRVIGVNGSSTVLDAGINELKDAWKGVFGNY